MLHKSTELHNFNVKVFSNVAMKDNFFKSHFSVSGY